MVHGYDVAQVFYQAIVHRNRALGEAFDAESADHVTLYGFAKHMYEYFGREPKDSFPALAGVVRLRGQPGRMRAYLLPHCPQRGVQHRKGKTSAGIQTEIFLFGNDRPCGKKLY